MPFLSPAALYHFSGLKTTYNSVRHVQYLYLCHCNIVSQPPHFTDVVPPPQFMPVTATNPLFPPRSFAVYDLEVSISCVILGSYAKVKLLLVTTPFFTTYATCPGLIRKEPPRSKMRSDETTKNQMPISPSDNGDVNKQKERWIHTHTWGE